MMTKTEWEDLLYDLLDPGPEEQWPARAARDRLAEKLCEMDAELKALREVQAARSEL